ncbi:Uncharacterized protein ACO02O_03008 [Dirofilaria immitis]
MDVSLTAETSAVATTKERPHGRGCSRLWVVNSATSQSAATTAWLTSATSPLSSSAKEVSKYPSSGTFLNAVFDEQDLSFFRAIISLSTYAYTSRCSTTTINDGK